MAHRHQGGIMIGRGGIPRNLVTLSLACALLVSSTHRAWAYRPFDGTDAGVAAQRTLEIELGPLEYARAGDERRLIVPSLALTYGMGSGIEVGVAGRRWLLMSPDADGVKPAFDDIEASVSKLVRVGSNQDKSGVSIASEATLLFPGSGEKRFGQGFEVVASDSWDPLTLHLNAAIANTRTGAFGRFASAILEGPDYMHVRPVAELTWERAGEDPISRGLLLGLIWTTRTGLTVDFGVRTTKSDVDETEIRSGITWNRHVHGPRLGSSPSHR
jgi:hypothetical protein